jgi:methylmalonyl-CoA/ethylmalonyl-CoA epimerase
MKAIKLDHIGVAVRDAEPVIKLYRDVLGLKLEGDEVVKEQKVRTIFLPVGDTEIELLESTESDGPVAKFLETSPSRSRTSTGP